MKQKITDLILSALETARVKGELILEAMPAVTVEEPSVAGHGDFATTVALSLAKPEKKPPRAIAEIIRKHIADSEGLIDKVEIAGPGYINFFLKPEAWLRVLKDAERDGRDFGRSNIGGGRKVQVEFVSANPTGPLHIGHGRGAAVGDSLCRLLAFTGYDVQREFYINDYGRQVENLGESIYMRYRQLMGDEGPEILPKAQGAGEAGEDVEPGADLYMGEYVMELAREFMEAPEFMALPDERKKEYCREEGIKAMLRQIEATLSKFGVGFDEWYSERKLYSGGENLVIAAIEELRGKGLVYESGGAVWLNTMKFGDDKDRVLIRKNGQTTYFASDIAYHRDKFQRGFDTVIDIWGADHHGYIPRMKAAVAALGHDPDNLKVLLVQMVNLLREGQPVKMSKRSGEFVTLDEVASEVGADACRFTFLLRRSDSHLDFDLDLVKRQSAENPVYYVQYAHARLCSVFRQAEERGIKLPPMDSVDLSLLVLPEELSIMRKLCVFPDLIEASAVALEPHRLTYYLQELASELHAYYFKHRIIALTPAPPPVAGEGLKVGGDYDLPLTYARMYFVKAVRTVVANALSLLGVNTPESM